MKPTDNAVLGTVSESPGRNESEPIGGAIAGDVISSIYELHQIKTETFPPFDSQCQFTDATVMTVAVAGMPYRAPIRMLRSGLLKNAL
jgi:hypothetical protein